MDEKKFNSDQEALDYVADKIAIEAKRQGIPLLEVERKMLYFSETDWTLPGILEVNAEFERDYDEDEYERKICGLGQTIEAQLKNASAEESDLWYAAIQELSKGDRYLLVLLNPRLVPAAPSRRPPGDLLRLWLTALGVVFGGFALMALCNWLFGARFWSVMDWFSNRDHFYLVLLLGALIWVLRSKLRETFLALWNRD